MASLEEEAELVGICLAMCTVAVAGGTHCSEERLQWLGGRRGKESGQIKRTEVQCFLLSAPRIWQEDCPLKDRGSSYQAWRISKTPTVKYIPSSTFLPLFRPSERCCFVLLCFVVLCCVLFPHTLQP